MKKEISICKIQKLLSGMVGLGLGFGVRIEVGFGVGIGVGTHKYTSLHITEFTLFDLQSVVSNILYPCQVVWLHS